MQTVEVEMSTEKQHRNGNNHASFADLLDEYEFTQPHRGDILDGEILRIKDDVLYVDVGAKRDALVPHDEVDELDEEWLDSLSRGDQVPVYVMRTPLGEEELLVSVERGLQKLDWERADELQAEDETVELEVVGHNRGGLLVEFGRLRGFVPNSHIPGLRHIGARNERTSYKEEQIGSTLSLKIIEVVLNKERLVLSAKAAQREQRRQRLQELNEGSVVTGDVVNMKPYGAFVDIGDDLTGLLHISKIAWDHIDHPSQVLEVGDKLELLVDEVDVERERVSLNRKVLLPDPWEQFAIDHDVGDLVEGEVTAVVDFGAFVRFPIGIEGLLHKSEMHISYGDAPSDALQPGDNVLVRIMSIEPERQRLSLSMRRVSATEEVNWMAAKHAEDEEPEELEEQEQ